MDWKAQLMIHSGAGTGDILAPRWRACWSQSCSLIHWLCCSDISFSSLTIVSFGSNLHSHSRSPPNLLMSPSGQSPQWLPQSSRDWTTYQWNDEMKYFIFYFYPQKENEQSLPSFSPFTIQRHSKTKGVYFYCSITCWTNKNSCKLHC